MKNKTTAGLLAIFLGTYGAQHFYLEDKDKAVKYLLVSLLTFGVGAVVIAIISLIEGIKFLSMSEDEFNALYNGGVTPTTNSGTKTQQANVSFEKNKIEQLKQYKELYDAGAITELEYNKLKRELL